MQFSNVLYISLAVFVLLWGSSESGSLCTDQRSEFKAILKLEEQITFHFVDILDKFPLSK